MPDWETLLAHAAALQAKIPSAILVGGTAAAVHSRHRFSIDHDHVVANLAKEYDTAIRALETMAGGKLVLGSVGGIAAGLRNLRRSAVQPQCAYLAATLLSPPAASKRAD